MISVEFLTIVRCVFHEYQIVLIIIFYHRRCCRHRCHYIVLPTLLLLLLLLSSSLCSFAIIVCCCVCFQLKITEGKGQCKTMRTPQATKVRTSMLSFTMVVVVISVLLSNLQFYQPFATKILHAHPATISLAH